MRSKYSPRLRCTTPPNQTICDGRRRDVDVRMPPEASTARESSIMDYIEPNHNAKNIQALDVAAKEWM